MGNLRPFSPKYGANSVVTLAANESRDSSENRVLVRLIMDFTAMARVNSSAEANTASLLRVTTLASWNPPFRKESLNSFGLGNAKSSSKRQAAEDPTFCLVAVREELEPLLTYHQAEFLVSKWKGTRVSLSPICRRVDGAGRGDLGSVKIATNDFTARLNHEGCHPRDDSGSAGKVKSALTGLGRRQFQNRRRPLGKDRGHHEPLVDLGRRSG